MAKIPFNISKNEQYIECHRPFKLPNGKYSGMIRVYELLNASKANMLTTMDWSFQPEIVDPNATTGYNSLQIDGQLVDLEKLVQDLCKSRLRVNKLGYCYFQIMQGVADTTETYGFAFYRLNDMLKWSEYGVYKKLGKTDARTLWDRLDILHGSAFDVKELQQEDNNNTVIAQQKAQIQKLIDRNNELETQFNQKNNNDTVNNQRTKAQIQKLTDRNKELEAQLNRKNNNDTVNNQQTKAQIQKLTDRNKELEAQLNQKDNDTVNNQQTKSQIQKLTDRNKELEAQLNQKDNNDTVNNQQTKSQIQKLTDRNKELEAQLNQKDNNDTVNNQRTKAQIQKLSDRVNELEAQLKQKDNNDTVNEQQKTQIRKLTDQVKKLEAQLDQKRNNDNVNNQQKSQIQKLTDRVKELETQLERYVPKVLSKYYVATTIDNFSDIQRNSNYPQVKQTMVQYWESRDYKCGSYTLTRVRETMTGKYVWPFQIRLKPDEGFDTSNWYCIGVKENPNPIVVYEGTMYTVNVAGNAMSSPIDGSVCAMHNGMSFGPAMLEGIGYRICLIG